MIVNFNILLLYGQIIN